MKAAGVAERMPTAQPPAVDLGSGVCASGLNGLTAGGLEGLKSVSTNRCMGISHPTPSGLALALPTADRICNGLYTS